MLASNKCVDNKLTHAFDSQVMFHFFLDPFLKGLYARPELVPLLHTDTGDPPEAHLRRSRGWKAKVLENPGMNGDHRNLGILGSTDGVPLFDDQRRSAWPFVYRVANLPDAEAQDPRNVHLALLAGCEYLEVDEKANCIRRITRDHKSLAPYLTVLVDELIDAYRNGIPVADTTYEPGEDGRNFFCKCLLLFWMGDYPAQCKVSGTHDKMCHWCTYKSEAAPEINRRCWTGARRFLGEHHPFRTDVMFGPVEHRPAPPNRTHAGMINDALENTQYEVHVLTLC